MAAVGALWGSANWGGGNVNINTNRQIAGNQNNWQHNAANRRGTPYRDQRSQQQFGRNVPGAENRADFRGRDNAGRDAQRQQAQSALQQRGMDPGQGRQNLRNDPGTRDRAQRAAEGTGRGDRAGDRGGQFGDRGGAGGNRGGQFGDRGAQVGNRGGAGTGDRGGQFGGGAGAGGRGGQGFEQVQSRGGDNALRGANSGQARQQMDRGATSRQSMGGRGGGGGARAGGFSGGGGRGGGGGGRGGGRR